MGHFNFIVLGGGRCIATVRALPPLLKGGLACRNYLRKL